MILRGTKGLYKRKDSAYVWCCFEIEKGKPPIRKSTKKKTMREAEIVLNNLKKEFAKDEFKKINRVGRCKFRELVKEYVPFVKNQKSFANSKKYFVKKLEQKFGDLYLHEMDQLKVEKFKAELLDNLNISSINRIMACLHHMIGKAVEWKLATKETEKEIRNVKIESKKETKRLRFLSLEECVELIDCCDEHLKPIVTIALHSGMRKSEILKLEWDQIDLKHGFILLDKTKSDERREIPINSTLEEIFRSTENKSTYVFVNEKTGKPYTDVKNSFHSALKRAGIHDFHFHDLRHTHASQLVMNGIDLPTIQSLLGHKDIKMTLRYAHLSPGHRRKATNLFEQKMQEAKDEFTFTSRFQDSNNKSIIKPPHNLCNSNEINGGAEGIRTPDLLHAMQALSQLSYSPNL